MEITEPTWIVCPQCKKEWSSLVISGICIDCSELQERIKQENKLKEGEKVRVDING